MSDNGIPPPIWGPIFWKTIHMIASTYPRRPTEKDKDDYYAYFKSIGNILPCAKCRTNYYKHISQMGFGRSNMFSQETLFRFSFDLHNMVNRGLGKPIEDDYDYIRSVYEVYKSI
jgi:hypothetical protein